MKNSKIKSKRILFGFLITILLFGVLSIKNNFNVLNNIGAQIENKSQNIPSEIRPAAGRNVKVYLLGTNQSYTPRGTNFTFSGYTQKFNTLITSWENQSNIPVYPIINSEHFDGRNGPDTNLTVRSGIDGLFSISLYVNETWDYLNQDFEVWANITQIPAENIWVGVDTPQNLTDTHLPIQHDITSLAEITVWDEIEDPVLPGDQYFVRFNLTDNFGNPIQSQNFTAFQNGNPSQILSQYDDIETTLNGRGSITATQLEGLTSFGVFYTGDGYTVSEEGEIYYQIAPSQASTNISRVTSIGANLSFTNADNASYEFVFTGGNVIISGTLFANGNNSLLLANRDFSILAPDNSIVFSGTTDANGQFSEELSLDDDFEHTAEEDLAITIRLDNYDTTIPSADVQFSQSLNIEIQDDPNLIPSQNGTQTVEKDWTRLILPAAIVIGVIVGIVVFQRFRMQNQVNKERKLKKVDYTRFSAINLLYNMGRKREAIAYTYKIFSDLINEKYGLQRERNQTLREFGIECVTRYGLDPLRTYPFIGLVENIIYGAYDLNQSEFQKSMTIFGRVFQEITGTSLDFTLEISQADSEDITLKIGAVHP